MGVEVLYLYLWLMPRQLHNFFLILVLQIWISTGYCFNIFSKSKHVTGFFTCYLFLKKRKSKRRTIIFRIAPLPLGEHLQHKHQHNSRVACPQNRSQIWVLWHPHIVWRRHCLRGNFTPGNYLLFFFAFGGKVGEASRGGKEGVRSPLHP